MAWREDDRVQGSSESGTAGLSENLGKSGVGGRESWEREHQDRLQASGVFP